jgi:hypothetical protein
MIIRPADGGHNKHQPILKMFSAVSKLQSDLFAARAIFITRDSHVIFDLIIRPRIRKRIPKLGKKGQR